MSAFAYANARVRAWKSYLFDATFFEKLLAAKNYSDVSEMLSQTPYQEDIEKGVVKYKGVSGIEEGLRLNLTRNLQKLLKIVSDDVEAQQLVELILTRWDVYNLKTILRGFHANASEEEIFERLIPVGTLDEAALQTLVKQPAMKAAISQLIVFSPQYAGPLISGFRVYKENKNLGDLELKLDKFYFSYVLEKTSSTADNPLIINQLMRREIDFVNMMTLLRLSREPLPEDINITTYFIEGGKELSISKLTELAKIKDIKKTIEALAETSYRDGLNRGLQKYMMNSSMASIERALEDYNTRKIISLFIGDPLSVSLIAAYVWAKINEIINIRIILRGKEVQMPPQEIREALIFG